MKRYSIFIMVMLCAIGSAQNINDVVRYSTENLQGTARFQGLSGAFGALGGDLSAININPAGAAIFNNSLFTISGSNYNNDNDVTYFNTTNNTDFTSWELNQIGAVFVFKSSSDDAEWKKITLGLNYDVVENYDNEFFASGRTNQGIDNYFLNFSSGTPLGPLFLQDGEFIEQAYLDIGAELGFADQQTFLGYFGGVIDPVDINDNDNRTYVSNASYTTVNQDFLQSTSGFNSKFNLNLASQYKDHLYIGASLNFHTVVYDRLTRLSESGFDADSEIQFIDFDNLLHTEGNGFSFSVGAIAKLNNSVRIGGSYQSPTWYRLRDDTSQRINSNLADDDISFIDFTVVNLFEAYTIKTPGKVTGSLALIFGKQGLLSFDYGYQDFTEAQLRPTGDPSFATVNDAISTTLGEASTFRVGGEYKIDNVTLRGGYRFEESPYADGQTIGDLSGYSAGLGFNFGGSRLDLTYSRSEQDINEQLFDTGVTTPAFINAINTNITLSYTLNL